MLAAFTSNAAAMGVGVSVGEGVVIGEETVRTPVDLEILPSFGFGMLKADMGVLIEMEKENRVLLRPGIRLDLWLIYARSGMQMVVSGDYDWGFLLGVGADLIDLGFASLFLEVDASFFDSSNFEIVPIQGRLGLDFGF